ncbi:MAG: thioredoxin family protein [Flavobacteriales bacterium]
MKRLFIISFFLSLFLFAEGNAQKVNWMSWKEAVYANQNQEAKKLFVDVYTDWCGWCKKMDRNTFSDPDIANYLNEHYYPVKLNAERKDAIIMGKDTLVNRKGTHELALKLMGGKASYPTLVFLNEQLQMIQPVRSYLGPKKMMPVLVFFGENYHKKGKDINKFIKRYPKNVKEKRGEGKSEKGKADGKKAKEEKKKGQASGKKEKHKDHPIDWMSWEEMIEERKKDTDLVFIDIYTDWCGPCKLLDKRTFRYEKVASFINEHFHAVKFNAEMRDTIRFKGKNYTNQQPQKKDRPGKRDAPHQFAKKLVDGRLAYPTMVVLDEDWDRVKMIRGYKGPSDLLGKLRPLVGQSRQKGN